MRRGWHTYSALKPEPLADNAFCDQPSTGTADARAPLFPLNYYDDGV